MPRKSPQDRFWEKVEKTDGCWGWKGGKFTSGYGSFHVGRRTVLVHRFSWELHFGPIPPDKQVLQSCKNRACPRPDHLYLGKRSYGSLARFHGGPDGIRTNAKLNEAEVREIRETWGALPRPV